MFSLSRIQARMILLPPPAQRCRRPLLHFFLFLLWILSTSSPSSSSSSSFVSAYPISESPSSTAAVNQQDMATNKHNARRWVLVTGGNKGIGRAVCERILTEWSDAGVVMGSRDATRGEEAARDVLKATSTDPSRLRVLEVDTSSDESVRRAAQKLRSTLGAKEGELAEAASEGQLLYGIVNNAGIGWGYTVRDTINTNYFGPQRVNDEFGPMLVRPGGRIVNVASASGPNFLQALKDEDPIKVKLSRPWTLVKEGGIQEIDALATSMASSGESENGYGMSKALLNAYTCLYAKANPDLVVNSVTPGWIKTDLTKGSGASNSPSQGAVPICKLLMDEAFADPQLHPTGRYYGSDAVRSPLHYYRGPGEPPYVSDDDAA